MEQPKFSPLGIDSYMYPVRVISNWVMVAKTVGIHIRQILDL